MRGALSLLLVGAAACETADPIAPDGGDLVHIDAGGYNTCGLDGEGRVFCWGRDFDTTPVPSPTELAFGPLRFRDVAVGRDYACALPLEGTPLCWQGVRGKPFTLAGAPVLDHMVIGQFPCGVTPDGAIWCWNAIENLPAQASEAGELTGLSVDQFACALTASGKARCWGGPLTFAPSPVHDSVAWDQVVAMTGWACGVPVGGSATCFTVNSFGVIGPLAEVSKTVIADGTRFAKLAGESNRLGLITDGGRAYNKTINQVNPTPEGSTIDWLWITSGTAHFCGEVPDGTLRCWWENAYGQLGDGTTTFRANAVPIGGAP